MYWNTFPVKKKARGFRFIKNELYGDQTEMKKLSIIISDPIFLMNTPVRLLTVSNKRVDTIFEFHSFLKS